MQVAIARSTPLAASPAEVWRHATSLDGINREMAPWLRMTVPPAARGVALDDAAIEPHRHPAALPDGRRARPAIEPHRHPAALPDGRRARPAIEPHRHPAALPDGRRARPAIEPHRHPAALPDGRRARPAIEPHRHPAALPDGRRARPAIEPHRHPAALPAGRRARPAIALGAPLFTSFVLLGGVVPIERMRVTLTELEPGRRFVERSPMLAVRAWRHERTIDPHPAGCLLTDRVSFEPRVAATSAVLRAAVGALFAHRHRQLGRIFNRR